MLRGVFARAAKSMSLANKISLMRILLVPLFAASLLYYSPLHDELRYVSFALFLIGMATDAIDGFIARSQQQQTELGRVLDPIADKLLILTALISLSTIHAIPQEMRIPAWFNLIVISRDVVVVTGTMLIFAFTGHWTVRPSWMGKAAVASQMVVVAVVLLRLPIKLEMMTVAAVLSVLSGIGYLRLGIRVLG